MRCHGFSWSPSQFHWIGGEVLELKIEAEMDGWCEHTAVTVVQSAHRGKMTRRETWRRIREMQVKLLKLLKLQCAWRRKLAYLAARRRRGVLAEHWATLQVRLAGPPSPYRKRI